MKQNRILVAVFACCVLAVAAYTWAKVVSDHDPTVDFAGYSTFGWIDRDDAIEAQLPEHLRMRLRRVTEEVLGEKGFLPAPAPPQTDFQLTYHFGATDELEVYHVSYSPYRPWGYGYWGGYNYGYSGLRKYKKGTLVLDIVDARTHKLVWVGYIEKEVQSTNPSGKRITKSVTKLLKTFPPKK